MNILYIGSFPPRFLVKRSGGKIDSLYRDSQPLIKGLRNQEGVNLKVITSPDVVSYPKGPLYIKKEYDSTEDVTLVGSLNISLLKQIWTIVSMTLEAGKYIRHSKKKVAVIIPYIVFRHVFTLRLLKFLHPRKVLQVCVVPDIFFPSNWFHCKVNRWTEKMASKFDCFVLYTEKMAEHLNVPNGKYIIIEGYREVLDREPNNDNLVFKVVYAGLLNLRYGVGRLVDAMSFIKDNDIQLHIYGSGDGVTYIRQKSKTDDRIVFHGRVPNAEATDAIYSASALINPRNCSDGEYVEYSFPSKDIEYLSTGIPTLLCKLPGMPKEYYGYFIDLKDANSKQIANAILEVKQMEEGQRKEFGAKARAFIIDRMDYNQQAERIISLIEKII